ncbi:MAG: hypothetical protein AVDCRST_MAG67-4075 [uncultured Solirubrobacteraceae bacterium]|uniref:DOD-type homing endonuclease domain-containing protein n=1 Tax=uncultured Solirubrobacteraceae bacterium TaxID=1162706 RepID=A0A6J4TRM0_9ACTN|nr:MAG: hypothetical protein AVDCRST_MAG67-4075 [uncultured Solirubrobacteraceae bacterium]
MHPPAVHARIVELMAEGSSDAAISAASSVARTTVRDIRSRSTRLRCPRCWRGARPMSFSAGEYAELLGFYLGDGYIVATGRSYRLRIFLDAAHPGIADEVCALLCICFGANRVGRTHLRARSTVVASVYSVHLPCLFPQHGPGVKHERPIVLEDWQQASVVAAPWSFIRGLILSDGCAFINRTGRYRYLSYDFCNRSADIRRIFMASCDLVGVRYTTNSDRVRIYGRACVRDLAAYVGTKR